MNVIAAEKTMTIKEMADTLGVSSDLIQKRVREIYPGKMIPRQTTLLNEVEVTAVKLRIQENSSLFSTGDERHQLPKTDLEKELIIQQALMIQNDKINELELKNRDLLIKADVADSIAAANGLILPSDAGKQISGRPMKFIGWMENEGILFRRKKGGTLLPKSSLQSRGYFEVKTREFAGELHEQTYLTGKGIAWICAKYRRDNGLLPFPIDSKEIAS